MSDYYWKGTFNECYKKCKSEDRPDLTGCTVDYWTGEDLNHYGERFCACGTESKGRYEDVLFDDDAHYKVWFYMCDRDVYYIETIMWVEPVTEEQLEKKIVKKRDIAQEFDDYQCRKAWLPNIKKEIQELEKKLASLRDKAEEIENLPERKMVTRLFMSKSSNDLITLFRRVFIMENGKEIESYDETINTFRDENFAASMPDGPMEIKEC